jgi:hypothetical protein
MANGWAPRTGEEFFVDLMRNQRIQERRPGRQTSFEDATAIDASTAPDLEPLDSYVEGLDEFYPIPVVPGVGDDPPDHMESSDSGDTLPEEETLPEIEATTPSGVLGQAWVDSAIAPTCNGSSLNFSGMTYSAPIDAYSGLGGESIIPIADWVTVAGNEVILANGWYEINMWMTLGWNAEADAPAALGPYMYGPGGSGVFYSTWTVHPRVKYAATKWGFQVQHHAGKVWLGDGDNSIYPDIFIPVAGGVTSTEGSVSWSISKLT